MSYNERLTLAVTISDQSIIEKLDILKLEKGISLQPFIIKSIAEKLQREGFLQEGYNEHVKEEKPKSDLDLIHEKLMELTFKRRS